MVPILLTVAELLCLAAVAVGVALVFIPAGVIVAGVLGVAVIERR